MRTRHLLLIPAIALLTLGLVAAPVAGQSRTRPDQNKATARAVPRRTAPESARSQAARPEEPRQQAARPQQPRPEATRPQARPPDNRASGPRRDEGRRVEVRRDAGPRYVPRREINRAYIVPRRVYRPTYRFVGPPRFARAYFTFRSHLTIGFGLWIGHGVPYPYGYVRGWTPRVYGSIGVMRGVSIYGGVSFNIAPYDALVFVDGHYVGRVDDFSPVSPPLTLTPGFHRIEVHAGGYQPMAWDVEIVPGQVIPYQGAMMPY